ncbi:hypothetical protein KIS1582_4891 [Cytobacillus firmus]|uniref:Uncharacterized protein n=1 Tax=Cytobacillus firmus TaxID=1399 RepID=A0A800N8C2_CYTFI|nr:hypothetical protein KIS1582_4891 [Cytobacillus firmus]
MNGKIHLGECDENKDIIYCPLPCYASINLGMQERGKRTGH